MRKHEVPRFSSDPGDILSRDSAREAIRRLYRFLFTYIEGERRFRSDVITELETLYGEQDYTPALIADGDAATVTISTPNAQLGYAVDYSYDQSLQGLQATPFVDSEGVVKIALFNGTGSGVTLTAGRFRVYCWARELTS